ncbi:unnamed protein product [Thlaspi arvense]|uniref:Uncharacterized protein n=1 Tax=Thlaspi arvense TaxID=13288 RepID=A0AAU9R8T2_THLAR|nr:unnamed protein product [Thlaspi arvense]
METDITLEQSPATEINAGRIISRDSVKPDFQGKVLEFQFKSLLNDPILVLFFSLAQLQTVEFSYMLLC